MNKLIGNNKLLFETLSGSKLYGTDSEKSDTDIKGVFLPNIEDLILGKAPKTISYSSGSIHDKNTSDDVDKTYYSLQYFLELAAKGETNCIDILFAFTNDNAIQFMSQEWNILIKNIDKIITKNMNAYLGYCRSQCQKYNIKGEKLNNYFAFLKMCEYYINDKNENGSSNTLYNVLCKAFHLDSLENMIPKVVEDRTKINFNNDVTNYNFGEHCYFTTANNKESYISISDIKFTLSDSVKSAYHKCKNVIDSYGQRAKAAASNDGSDLKALSHCVRVLLQVEELIETGKIVFPLKHADFIKSIKYNTSHLTRDEIMEWIEKKFEYINMQLEKSTLREKADFNWIKNFILTCYK